MGWIDCKKAHDMVPYALINEGLGMHKVDKKIRLMMKTIIDMWRSVLECKRSGLTKWTIGGVFFKEITTPRSSSLWWWYGPSIYMKRGGWERAEEHTGHSYHSSHLCRYEEQSMTEHIHNKDTWSCQQYIATLGNISRKTDEKLRRSTHRKRRMADKGNPGTSCQADQGICSREQLAMDLKEKV